MSYRIILRYSASALAAAAIVTAIALVLRLLLGHRPLVKRDMLLLGLIAYLAAVIQITGLRVGLVSIKPLGGTLRLTPLFTTVEHWYKGPGAFIYHTVGNLFWFLPVGIMLPCLSSKCRLRHVLICGAALSMFVEALQFLLGTGMTDIDDMLLNTLGAVLGYVLRSLYQIIRYRT